MIATVEPMIYKPLPTVRKAILSAATYVVLTSDRGGGKSLGAAMSNYHWAVKRHREDGMALPVRYAVVRDTAVNIGRSTAKMLKEWFPEGEKSTWRGKAEAPDSCVIHDDPYGAILEYHFIGCDRPGAFDLFQSFEIGGLWLIEPAPAGSESSGIPAEAFAMAVSSSRQNRWFRAVIEFNTPPPDHYLCQLWPQILSDPTQAVARWSVPEDVRRRFTEQSEVFVIPPWENAAERFRSPGYRQRMADAFLMAGRPDMAARLVGGQVVDVQEGELVCPEFDESVFVVDGVAPIRPGEWLLFSWDGGHQPACVIWRPRPGVAVEVVAAFQAEHAGMAQFLKDQVTVWTAAHVPYGVHWQHVGDPNLKTGDQGNIDFSALRAILAAFPIDGMEAGWTPGPVSQAAREQAMHDLLLPGQRPPLRIDAREAHPLVRALKTGWRRTKNASGSMVASDWQKNLLANVAEAGCYGAWLLLRRGLALAQQQGYRAEALKRLDRAKQRLAGSLTHV